MVARPSRETQVVAHEELHLDPLVLEDGAVGSAFEELVLAAVGVEVALVLYLHLGMRSDHEATID